jgi:hypothetical protein
LLYLCYTGAIPELSLFFIVGLKTAVYLVERTENPIQAPVFPLAYKEEVPFTGLVSLLACATGYLGGKSHIGGKDALLIWEGKEKEGF